MKGRDDVEVFISVTAEISKDFIEKYVDLDKKDVHKHVKTISEKTGVTLVSECEMTNNQTLTVKGPWLAITKTRTLLKKYIQAFNSINYPNEKDFSKLLNDKESHTSLGQETNSDPLGANSQDYVCDPVVKCNDIDGVQYGVKSSTTDQSPNGIKTEEKVEDKLTEDDRIDEDLLVDFSVNEDNEEDSDYLPEEEPVKRKLRSKKNSKAKKNPPRKSRTKQSKLKKTKTLSENVAPRKKKSLVKSTKVSVVGKSHDPSVTDIKEVSDSEVEYQCQECSYVGKKKALLRQHIRRFHRTKDFPCNICGRIFGFNKDLTHHMKSHQKPQNCCDICGKLYKGLRSLAEHRKTHEDNYEKPEFQCDMCDKSFSTKYVLKYHVKSEHMGLKRSYLCPTCGKSFSQKHSYLQHANVHLGIRNYKCDLCDKAFAYEKSLREHKFMHDNIRRFKCQSCDKCFRQSSALAIHARIHKVVKDYVCSQCQRGFSQKQALKRHERIHLGEKPFLCNLCSKNFTDSSVLRRHMILIHKKEPKKWREDTVSLVKKGHYFIDVLKDTGQSTDEMEQTATFTNEESLPHPDTQLTSQNAAMKNKENNITEEKMYPNVTSQASITQTTPVPQHQTYHHESPNNPGTVLSVPAIAGLASPNHMPHTYNPMAMYPNLDHNIYNIPSSSQYLQTQPINLHTLENVSHPAQGYYPHEYPSNLPPSNKHYDISNSN